MENPFYQVYQEGKLVKSIEERKHIIDYYIQTGYMDRNYAIQKIMELRNQDAEINVATNLKQVGQPTISLNECSPQQLAWELDYQIRMLAVKLKRNSKELVNSITSDQSESIKL